MSMAIICGNGVTDRKQHQPFIDLLTKQIKQLDPSITLEFWPNIKNPEAVDCVSTWLPDPGVFDHFPSLKAVFSLGAGVDHILKNYTPPPSITLTRIVDPQMAIQMAQYVCGAVLDVTLKKKYFAKLERERDWNRMAMLAPKAITIGILGLGYLGGQAARSLCGLNFNVIGWSRGAKHIDGVKSYHGEEQLTEFLNHCDIAISLLPLTTNTKHLLNAERLSQLKDGAHVVNVSRGDIINEADLLAAIDSGKLSGATLDVFSQEPLPQDHPFWPHEKITVTPHMSAITNPTTVCHQLVSNYHALQKRETLHGVVDISREY